jgi:hypothetical protein
MHSGMSYNKLKRTLMKFYDVTSTDLDKGHDIPYCVYCIKSFFRFQKQWIPQDFVKIGKSFSVANRARTYSQSGADVKTLWTMELAYPGLADEIENLVHNFGYQYHAGSASAHCTEMFDLNVQQAFVFLQDFIEEHDILNDNRITKIHMFDEDQLITINSNVEPCQPFIYRDHVNNFFEGF